MISIELVKSIQADRDREIAARARSRTIRSHGRRIRINRRGQGG